MESLTDNHNARCGAHRTLRLKRAWLQMLLKVLLAGLLIGAPLPALAAGTVVVIKSAATSLYDEMIDSAREAFVDACRDSSPPCEHLPWIITDIQSDDELGKALVGDVRAVVTVGEKAATWLSEQAHIPGPVFFSLIPRATFETIRSKLPDTLEHTALYLDQPLSRQLQLIRACFPQRTQLGVLSGPVSRSLMPELRVQAKSLGLNVKEGAVSNFEDIGPTLKDLMEESEVLLSLPDPVVFNQRTVFSILLSTYHNQIPVVGFSSSYVRAGALIAIHSTPAQLGRQLGESLQAHFVSPHPGAHFEYPRYFGIARNTSVARSLQITLPDDDTLTTLLEREAP